MKSDGLKLSTSSFAKPKVEKLNLLKGIANIIKNTATGAWTSIPADALETLNAIKFEDKPEMRGWKLISRSLADALFTLISESNSIYEIGDIETEPLDDLLNKHLENQDYFLKSNFFNDPKSLKLLDDIKPTLIEYLKLFQFNDVEANNIVSRLNSYFLYSLINEWRGNTQYYSELKDIIKTPFDEVEQKETEWQLYSNFLQTQIHKPIFSETFSLDQVYVPLRAYYKKKIKSKERNEDKPSHGLDQKDQEVKRFVVDLESHLIKWIKKGAKSDAIRIIRGGPGYGKSSFLKMLAAKLSKLGKKVLFIPLHRFDIGEKLDHSINEFLRYDKYLNYDPINDDNAPLIILFDGLDELSMQGKVLAEVAQSFLREVDRRVQNFNQRSLKLQCIVSGRDVIVQQNESEFRNDGQILRLLPYFLKNDETENLNDSKKLLEVDQRDIWWKNYGMVTGENYAGIPKELLTEEIDEITAQPLLNFLVALSFRRGTITFIKETNLNEVYADLLDAVHDRGYSDSKRLKAIGDMKYEYFCIVMEEIAISAWKGKGRTTTVNNIKSHFESSGLIQLLDQFIKDAEKGVVSLLAAFYFRQAGQELDGTKTFEFTHKSFGEYLTAKKIIRQLIEIHDQLSKNEKDPLKREGWSIEKCLLEWIKLFGIKIPDWDLIKFIRNEFGIIYNKDNELIESLQKTVVKLLNYSMNKGLPVEKIHPRLNYFKNEVEIAINSEKTFLIVHSILANYTQVMSSPEFNSNTSFGELISRIFHQRQTDDEFILNFFDYLNFDKQTLFSRDFYFANLKNTSLQFVPLTFSNFKYGKLQKSNLTHAYLNICNLQDAHLEDTILSNADLYDSNLANAFLSNAILTGARLTNAILTDADLTDADLTNADLTDADLTRADLTGANLTDAELKGAILADTILDRAILKGTILEKKNLKS